LAEYSRRAYNVEGRIAQTQSVAAIIATMKHSSIANQMRPCAALGRLETTFDLTLSRRCGVCRM
jgi:hypothetical protein